MIGSDIGKIGGAIVATASQKKTPTAHRRRADARGLARVELQATKADAVLIRALAETLRGEPQRANSVRATLEQALVGGEVKTAFDVFGSDIPDEAFEGIFDQPRQKNWRKVEL